MLSVTGNSMYLKSKEEVLWPEEERPPGKIGCILHEQMEIGVDAEDLFGEDGLIICMEKRMTERILAGPQAGGEGPECDLLGSYSRTGRSCAGSLCRAL